MCLVIYENNLKIIYLRLKLPDLTCSLIVNYILTNGLIKCIYVLKSKKSLIIIEELLLFHFFEKKQKINLIKIENIFFAKY